MIRSFLTVSTGTLASRLLGFLRDSMIAALLGAGPIADAFLAAFQMVNVIRRLLSEGALNAALVPAWLQVSENEGATAAAGFAGRVLGTVSAALIVLTGLLALVMPFVIKVIAPGFAGHETLELATNNARLMLPYLAFAGPVTVLMGLLNAQGRFALTAFSPLLFNIALIAVMIALLSSRQHGAQAALAVAATVGVAGLLQLVTLALRRGANTATPLRISFDREMRRFLGSALPGMIAGAGPQLLIITGAVVASSSPSAVSWLYFANRLIELPLGIVGVAMGTVLVPELTRALRNGDKRTMGDAESRGLELAIGLALPATIGLISLNEPVVRILFEHGLFTSTDSAGTAQVLTWLAFGLPAYVLVKSLSPAFFARRDTVTPLLATLKAIIVTIVAAFLLGHWFGASGIAGGMALGAWSNALALIRKGASTFGFSIDAAARRRLPRIALAAIAMGGLLSVAAQSALGPDGDSHRLMQALVLFILIGGAIAVYALLLNWFGVIGWREAIGALRRRPPGDLRT
ncbi:MAG TPA: murein biosynthesis integral membrane protein MurJ [Bradyrhizobium sp.]|nr:murein biosynthesis integral membrane protein MurJ [Bradyrhizobium sp.]